MLDTTFGRLVGGIYDAVVDPELWSEAIDAMRAGEVVRTVLTP